MPQPNAPFRLIAGLTLAAGSAWLIGCGAGPASSASPAGGAIIAVSDGDLVGTAFADGLLFGRDGDISRQRADALTVIALPLPEPGEEGASARFAQIEVMNSVLGAPRSVAMSRDGNDVFVLATRGRAASSAKEMRDLPGMGLITRVDLSSPMSPRIAGRLDLGRGVTTISLHPSGDLLAALRNTSDGLALDFVDVSGGGDPRLISTAPLRNIQPGAGVGAGTVAFSPSGDAIAVTVLGHDAVAFYNFERSGDGVAVWASGEPVGVGNFPYVGSWAPNGWFFITADLMWGDASTHDIENAPQGSVSVVRFGGASGGHGHVVSAFVGQSPEGLAVSPRGDMIATGNIGMSFLYEDDHRYTRGGTITLLSFNSETGEAMAAGEWPTGAAPQGLTFDATGGHLLVNDFESGAVQVWRTQPGDRPSLRFTGVRVGVGRGVHAVLVKP